MHESENEHVIAIIHTGLQVQSCMNERLYIMSWIFFQGLREGLGKLGSEWHPSCALGPSDTASNLRRIHSLRRWQHGDGLHHDVTSSRAPLFLSSSVHTEQKSQCAAPSSDDSRKAASFNSSCLMPMQKKRATDAVGRCKVTSSTIPDTDLTNCVIGTWAVIRHGSLAPFWSSG